MEFIPEIVIAIVMSVIFQHYHSISHHMQRTCHVHLPQSIHLHLPIHIILCILLIKYTILVTYIVSYPYLLPDPYITFERLYRRVTVHSFKCLVQWAPTVTSALLSPEVP